MIIKCVWEHNGDDSLLYSVDYVGAFTRGSNKDIAIKKMQEEITSYLDWKNEKVPETFNVEIVQEKPCNLKIADADSDVIFDEERKPLSREEYLSLKEFNAVYGYRTSMSMKNSDTWVFAHNYFGKLWYICGMILLPISLIAMICIMGKDNNVVGTVGGVVCFIQMVPLAGVIIPTEIALKRRFDKNGNRR